MEMTNLVEMMAKALVTQPEKVLVKKGSGADSDVITLQVASDDMGKVIGKQGRIAKALRTVVKAAGTKDNLHFNVEIISDEEAAGMAQNETVAEEGADAPETAE